MFPRHENFLGTPNFLHGDLLAGQYGNPGPKDLYCDFCGRRWPRFCL
jgi:hypothetical protein